MPEGIPAEPAAGTAVLRPDPTLHQVLRINVRAAASLGSGPDLPAHMAPLEVVA